MTTELLFRDDAYLKTAAAHVIAVHDRGIELDRTIFYPQGGGQAGDTGVLVRENGERIAIADTRKGDTMDSVVHLPSPETSRLAVGETLFAPDELGQLPVDLLFLGEHALLDLDDPRAVLRDLGVDLGAQPDSRLARADLAFAAERIGLALRIVEDLLPKSPCLAQPRLLCHSRRDHGSCRIT